MNSISTTLIHELQLRIIDESLRRIDRCLSMISENDLWRTPVDQVNSIGVNIHHLMGNARQWIGHGLLGKTDHRKRSEEFLIKEDVSIDQLRLELKEFELDLSSMIREINANHLDGNYSIQGFTVSGVSVVVHAIEHFSYHTGQITLLTKIFTERDTGYYSDYDLE